MGLDGAIKRTCRDQDRRGASLHGCDIAAIAVLDQMKPGRLDFRPEPHEGTLGRMFANRQLEAIAEMDRGGAWGEGGHLIPGTALAHVGAMTKLGWQLAAGTTLHLVDRWKAGDVLDLVDRFRIPAITGVAAQVALMLDDPSFDDHDFDCVQAIVVGGGPSPPDLVTAARRKFGAPYSNRYSSTESGGIGLATALDANDEEALHTVGRPRPGGITGLREHRNPV
jgi:acyl-coenzyme A synthetase/AMP-(fatty) acid ligase